MTQPVFAADRAIGRVGDRRLLTGRNQFCGDRCQSDMLTVVFVRSGIAHGMLSDVDTSEAREASGVKYVLTAKDLEQLGVGQLPVTWVHPGQLNRANPLLAHDKVYYVGQPIAAVVAESSYQAEDAAALVVPMIEELSPVMDVDEAAREDATLLYPEWGTNIFAEYTVEAGDVAARFADAATTLRQRLKLHRQTGVPMEGRAAVAWHDAASDQIVVWLTTQVPHQAKVALTTVLGWPEGRARVVAPDVGGGFGVKEYPQAEDMIVPLLAQQLRQPVRWIEDRREHFMSAVHAREQTWDVELAADKHGRILAVRGELAYVGGGHCSNQGLGVARLAADMLLGPYDIQDYRMHITGYVTNKVPAGAYRGFGRAQATFVMERLVDELARHLALDRAEVRRCNMIPTEKQPYTSATHHQYDGGDYVGALDRALERIGYSEFEAQQRTARSDGYLLGLGVCSMVMVAGLAPSKILGMLGTTFGGYESIHMRMEPTGSVVVYCGAGTQGQGHETTLAQLAAEKLGVDASRDVRVRLGDTGETPFSPAGAIASRVGSVGGAAVLLAAGDLRGKLCEMAAHMLEASADDIELAEGRAFVRGSPSEGLPIGTVAREAHLGHDMPEGLEPGLESTQTFDPPGSSYPYATHAAVVKIDPATGHLKIVRYVVVQDCGVMINPAIVEGQIIGGIAQGIGGALLEHLVYDESGQPLATSLMDYLLPTACEIPEIEIEHMETPAAGIPGGMKGVGEAGTVAPAAVLANAVANALEDQGVAVNELPLDPERVWRHARQALRK